MARRHIVAPPGRPRRATLSAVAARAGVSTSTASRLLNGAVGSGFSASAAVQQRVRLAAQALGYRRRGPAAPAGGTMAMLCVAGDPQVGRLDEAVLHGLASGFAAEGIRLEIAMLGESGQEATSSLAALAQRSELIGLILDYTHRIPPALDLAVRRLDRPFVWLNAGLAEDSANFADEVAAADLTRAFIAHGHRQIVFLDLFHDAVSLAWDHYSARQRQAGYQGAMREAGLRAVVRRPAHRPEGPSAWRAWCREQAALVAGGVTGFIGCGGEGDFVLAELLVRGLRLGTDVSFATFAPDTPVCCGWTVAHMRLDRQALGRAAATQLLLRQRPTTSVTVAATLVVAETLGPAPGHVTGKLGHR